MIVTGPGAIPATTPFVPTVAIDVLPLLQLPPEVPSVKFTDEPVQTLPAPVIPAGNGFTVTAVAIPHPTPGAMVSI